MAFRSRTGPGLLLTLPVSVTRSCVSPGTRSGESQPGADSQPALALRPPFSKQRGVSVVTPTRCHLVVFAVEIGGRWGSEPATFLGLLARARAARAHAAIHSALRAAYVSRWSSIIAVAAQRALASSLLELPLDTVALSCRRAGRA